MKLPRPSLVTLDVFGTVYTPAPAVELQYSQLAAQHGLHVPAPEIRRHFAPAFKQAARKWPNYGKAVGMPLDSWWTEVIRHTFKEAAPKSTVSDDMCAEMNRHFNSSAAYHVFPDSVDMIKRLHAGGVDIGVLSNSDPGVRPILDGLELFHYFKLNHDKKPVTMERSEPDNVFLSYETGYEKPDPRAFQAAHTDFVYAHVSTERAGLGQSRYWHVGDDHAKDFAGAIGAGVNAVLVDRTGELLDIRQQLIDQGNSSGELYVTDDLVAVKPPSGPISVYTNDMRRFAELFDL